MLNILQGRLQQYMNHELADFQVGFGKDSGNRDQITNIPWIIKKAKEFQKTMGSIPGLGRSSGGEHGNPLQHSCLENPQGQKFLAGCSPWGHKELDTTED